jgi:hypothetical protein
MHLHTVEPKTADQLIGRLREIERIAIRGANTPERLEFLRTNDFRSDGPVSVETMNEVKRRVDADMAEFTQRANWWEGTVWAL